MSPIILSPQVEPHFLRIDIIRQTESVTIGENQSETRDVEYHPMGFDIGNGLFFDLNDNLSLRVDRLLNMDTNQDFTIAEVHYPQKNKHIAYKKWAGDTLKTKWGGRKKWRYQYHKSGSADSLAFKWKSRLKYAAVDTDSTWIYRGKRRKWKVMAQTDPTTFKVDQRFGKDGVFIFDTNHITLNNRYIVSSTDDHKTIFILRKRGKKILYTIQRDENILYVFDRRKSGKKLVLSHRSLDVYENKRWDKTYRVEERD